jgi:hypothetical protein
MVFGLLEILLPFIPEVVIQYALERGLIQDNAASLVLERLQQELS